MWGIRQLCPSYGVMLVCESVRMLVGGCDSIVRMRASMFGFVVMVCVKKAGASMVSAEYPIPILVLGSVELPAE